MNELLECSGSEFYELGRELIESGHSLHLRVRGGSMFPWIRDGDLVQVSPVTMDEVEEGDILFFRRGRMLLAHRVVERRVDGQKVQLITRGDSHSQDDGPIGRPEDLIGRVERVYRGRRIIALDRGLPRRIGHLIARHRAVQRSLFFGVRIWRYGQRRLGAWLGIGPDRAGRR